MRPLLLSLFLSVAVLVPKLGNAQAYNLPTAPPQVTAANASWQINGEPVFFEGDFFFPTGPTVYFDGNVMRRSGMYRGVPLYVDSTLEPGSMVFVPVGGSVMRPYERKRYGELAGTVGSRAPTFPIQRDVELSASSGAVGLQTPALASVEQPVLPEAIRVQTAAATVSGTFNATGTFTTGAGSSPASLPPAIEQPPQARHIESVPPPQSNVGIWIEYGGARWYSAGAAVPHVDDRFMQIGDYRGFPVFRERNGPSNEIWIPAVTGGPLVPYRR